MAFVINGGGDKGANFQHFTDLCCTAYQELRRHTNLIINLLELVGRVRRADKEDRGRRVGSLAWQSFDCAIGAPLLRSQGSSTCELWSSTG